MTSYQHKGMPKYQSQTESLKAGGPQTALYANLSVHPTQKM